ncbi:universal stress protein PHOS32 [Syzygium oleosum]|uniref:universal stress protein PHOS32 n=1 Tax=Syzygium oleosum TaxID=219896 RepID=UPI0011D1F953|nr:universal stress protein PHOS32 [Syzygium oleosum]
METLEEEEEYSWREVKLPSLVPVVGEAEIPELERETGERRRGRAVLVAVDHGPNSKHAFDWALIHFCRLADTLHLVHAVSSVNNEVIHEQSQVLMEKLAVEAFQVAMVRTVARIVEGDPGKVICREAKRLKPAAVVMGTRGRSLIQSVLQGSVSEYCFHNCKWAPVIIVPGKEAGDESLV